MVFSVAWDRFIRNFGGFALTSLGLLIAGVASYIVLAVVTMVALMPTLIRIAQIPYMGPRVYPNGFGVADGLQMLGSMLPGLLLILVLATLVYGFVGAGVMGAVVTHRREQPVEFSTFWTFGARYFWRMTGLSALYLLVNLVVGGVVWFAVIMLIFPAIGGVGVLNWAMVPLMLALWLLLGGLTCMLMVNTAIYPAYLMVNDERGVLEAYGDGWRLIASNFGEAFTGGLVLLLFAVVINIAVVINVIPLLGLLAFLAFLLLIFPFIALYFSERFEQRIRPTF